MYKRVLDHITTRGDKYNSYKVQTGQDKLSVHNYSSAGGGEVRRLDEIYRAHLFGDLYVLCTDM